MEIIRDRLTHQVTEAPPELAVPETWLREEARRVAGEWQAAESQKLFVRATTIRQEVERKIRSTNDAWIKENARLLRTAARAVHGTARDLRVLPHVSAAEGAEPRAFVAATAYLAIVRGQFGEESVIAFLNGVQERCEFVMSELWAFKPMLQLSLLDQAIRGGNVPVAITSLRHLSESDWEEVFAAANHVDPLLNRDPAQSYEGMDSDSKDMYRREVAEIAKRSGRTEREVTARVLDLANRATIARQRHVGYFLIDHGKRVLRADVGYRAPVWMRIEDSLLLYGAGIYLVGIELITMLIMLLVVGRLHQLAPIVWVLLLLPLPASQAAVELMNTLMTSLLRPRRLPKMDFSEGVPAEFSTMVAVPTLLLDEKQVQELVNDLEIRYLANKDPHLYFALLSDTPDSSQPVDEKDELVSLVVRLIEGLNERYTDGDHMPFLLLHRHRVFNASENAWMGWERKRGKLLDLNKLLRGDFDSFPVKVGDESVFPKIRFVITLDSDTQLPRYSAQRMIGTLAHPLNRPVIDPRTNMVVAGYGILQPRVGVSVHSAHRSRLASLYSGETGFDIYTRAISDVYQDLFGEGIFTGKGIYDVDAFRAVLEQRFPTNALLSHDLIEGAYARVALTSEIEVIDDYPSRFSAYSRRKHRWVRGDWQISRWLLPRVPDFHGRMVDNPISVLSRWKILDNLRRSLLEPATFALLLAGWFYLPGGPVFWTVVSLGMMLLATYANVAFSLARRRDAEMLGPFLRELAKGFFKNHASVLINIAFLPHQAMTSLDAIVRTMIRSAITGRNMLEWETAAQAESGSSKKTPTDAYLDVTPWLSLTIAAAITVYRPEAALVATPFLVVWASARALAKWLDRPAVPEGWTFRRSSHRLLRQTALRTWRFFRTYSSERNGWLIPDNVQEEPDLIAERFSPTNLGMLLNARQAAWELGYLSLPEFVRQTRASLQTMARLERHSGHLFNWYGLQTLQPLEPRFVSTVDSGNLAASLYTLGQGCLAMARQPLVRTAIWQGLRDELSEVPETTSDWDQLGDGMEEWLAALPDIENALQRSAKSVWRDEALESLGEIRETISTLAPWCLPEHQPLMKMVGDTLRKRLSESSLDTLPAAITELETVLTRLEWHPHADEGARESLMPLTAALLPAKLALIHLARELREIAAEADSQATGMDFGFLYERKRKLLSIGFDATTNRREKSHYDLLASEARTASFIAIAKGDVPQEHWFHLSRSLTLSNGQRALLSWTGTMFEYLMPALWMRTYPQTVLEESMRAAILIQQQQARATHLPWGISEAAYCLRNEVGEYQYQAFGLKGLAMKQELPQALVLAPYASILALPHLPAAVMPNLRSLQKMGAWSEFGFYESIDATNGEPEVVRCWMAHHQGMSLLAITNLLLDSPFTRYFHADPRVLATELLLQEKVPQTVPVEVPAA